MTRLSRVTEKVKALGIGKPYECVNIFGQFHSASQPGCGFWTLERKLEHSKTHQQDIHPGAIKVLNFGCPKIDETQWCGLDSGNYDDEGRPLPAIERPCVGCEFLIPGIKQDCCR